MSRRPQPLRIAIDTGGTFTDCIWIDHKTHRLSMLKVFSTPADPSQAIIRALVEILSEAGFVVQSAEPHLVAKVVVARKP